MLAQISHVDVNLGLISAHIIIYLTDEEVESFEEVGMFLSDFSLICLEFMLHVVY